MIVAKDFHKTTMVAGKTSYPSSAFPTIKSSKQALIFSLFFLSVLLFLITTTIQPQYQSIDVGRPQYQHPPIPHSLTTADHHPRWLKQYVSSRLRMTTQKTSHPMKIALVNIGASSAEEYRQMLHGAETVTVGFDEVSRSLKWKDFFPEWINEDRQKCPRIPMPEFGKYKGGLDVVVVRAPCGHKTVPAGKGVRDLLRLQVNLVVANLVVAASSNGGSEGVYVVFVGGCEPMSEIFRCDDMVMHDEEEVGGKYWVYKPNVVKLKQKVIMPIGTCELARKDEAFTGNNQLEADMLTPLVEADNPIISSHPRKEAYVTVIHSSEQYVCGAIVLAQSILKTNTTRDLVLLADHTISPKSIRGLKSAGWKIKRIQRIRSPNAKADAYNEWNYSKLRVWQLTEYDKIMFIDSDFIVLHNIDHFFAYPQLSAAANDKWLFNSGIMILEPSQCLFQSLMNKRYDLRSYNGGDQGYLNEVFTWWHRLTVKINYMKIYKAPKGRRDVPDDRHTIHFLGLKPWLCYKDYDCNWDQQDHWIFASDAANNKWWEIYDDMPKGLKTHCGLTLKMDARIRKWRGRARKAGLTDGHWKIRIKDPRQYRLMSDE